MAQHVFARLSGFGWTLVPQAPFHFQRVPGDSRVIRVQHHSVKGPRQLTLSFAENKPTFQLGNGVSALEEVLDLLEGPDLDHWRIETSIFTCRWPESFAFASNSSSDMPPFYLHGPEGALLFVQGPFAINRLPARTDMVAAGQTLRRHGQSARGGWVELEYEHAGLLWLQTHRIVEDGKGYAVVVTSQSPEATAALTNAAGEEIAASLRLMLGYEWLG